MGRVGSLAAMRPRARHPFNQWMRTQARRAIRRFGYEIVRYPIHVNPLDGHLVTLFARQGINCVLDVGAHRGEFAGYLRNLGYRGRIISFEPIRANYEVLTRRSDGDDAWETRPFALGACESQSVIHRTRNTVFCSFLKPHRDSRRYSHQGSDIVATEEVSMRRLDTLFEECGAGIAKPRVYLKMDTQGYDLEVFEGAGDCRPRIVAVQSELSVKPMYEEAPGFRDALQVFAHHGFRITGMFPNAQEEDLTVVEFDCVLLQDARP